MTVDLSKLKAAQAPKSDVRVFYGEFQTFQNYLTPKGKVAQFYKGYLKTADPEVIEFCSALEGIVEVTDKVDASKIEEPPKRERTRNWASNSNHHTPHVFSPADLLQRAVANSSHTTQAARSDSSN